MLAVAWACKELRDLALPIIYRTVDLSVHNRPLTFDRQWWRDFNNAIHTPVLYWSLWLWNKSPLSTHCSRIQVLELTSVPLYGQFATTGIRQGPCQTNQGRKGRGLKLSPARHADMGSFSKSHQRTTSRPMLKPQELQRAISSYTTHKTLFNCHTTLPFWGHVSPDRRLYSGFHQFFKYENSRSQCLARSRPF